MPGLVEGDDGVLYVVKMRGAGQGPLALAAEITTGELARVVGLRVPDLVLVRMDPLFGRHEHDAEIRDLLRASSGMNMGLAFLEGATTFDVAAGDRMSEAEASLVVWLDAFTLNVDRTCRNPNLLRWKGDTWLIDHGASLYFHHNWPSVSSKYEDPFAAVKGHVLLPWAAEIGAASKAAHARLTDEVVEEIVGLVPEDWLRGPDGADDPEERRGAYGRFFRERLRRSAMFEEEVQRARTSLV